METTNETETSPEVAVTESERGASLSTEPLSVQNAVLLGAFVVAIAVIIGAFVVAHGPFAGKSAGDPSSAAAPAVLPPDVSKVVTKGEPYIGQANAPITLAYWSDYQCPFCKQFQTATLPSIVQNYVNTGKVRIVFKDFAFLGDDSTVAALYARAVWALYPAQYFQWHEAMFAAQDAENAGFGDEPSIQKLTATIPGIDAAKVTAAVHTNQAAYQAAIDADRLEATQYGIGGTPSFITGTTLIPGVATYAQFQQVFDAQLK